MRIKILGSYCRRGCFLFVCYCFVCLFLSFKGLPTVGEFLNFCFLKCFIWVVFLLLLSCVCEERRSRREGLIPLWSSLFWLSDFSPEWHKLLFAFRMYHVSYRWSSVWACLSEKMHSPFRLYLKAKQQQQKDSENLCWKWIFRRTSWKLRNWSCYNKCIKIEN